MRDEFKNECTIDFSKPEMASELEKAIAKVEESFGSRYPIVIAGDHILLDDYIKSINPSDTHEVVGYVSKGTRELADRAVMAGKLSFKYWGSLSGTERARYLYSLSSVFRKRRVELVATMMIEGGKTWPEADGEVVEAIDFLEYYAREAERMDAGEDLVRLPDEDNEMIYIPLGVGLAIPPWNFSLSILTGTTIGPVAAGNTVILKPASATPVIGAKFMEMVEEAGFPDGVINFLPGSGSEIGDYLVSHPDIHFIAFTGSMEVGIHIYQEAAKVRPGQAHLKKTVIEMGGKDAIIVDSSADLKKAAEGIVASAFGFQGQKCSACSRAIILEDIYDDMVERIVQLTSKLEVGDPRKLTVDMGPVIDDAAYKKIMSYIEIGKNEGRLIYGGDRARDNGYFIMPTVFKDVAPDARIAQEEIFGPVLSIIRAKDFTDALNIANNTVYGLTGSVYSKTREHLERARKEFNVGNLYFNRGCTGALVGVHPFGGFKLSGTDAKTGSHDYLKYFMQPKVISERF
ncbi:L-glutamate gamma-semialdehyde dehydrogenase [Calorimonas adulescens]|uniref:L-glutamate gamma-semialdehyde dehydrogenase n=1 Tax=Calorimonas adulescens TaxID=2606906 RepID=A0A5D8QAD4_9THEO|nr:L-glutamate gamma-semialdehyde dehydrogenase [Calorimonas adulescens]TZE81560.1 L-glutamate gamma-semialdehyde dehydrogenase [Calorimonas adulescens]